MEYGSYPVLGMNNYFFAESIRSEVVIENGERCLLLPRYIISSTGGLDLLSDETNFFFDDDVFREYKDEFKDAFVKETTTSGSYLWGLYDYEKVVKIIEGTK